MKTRVRFHGAVAVGLGVAASLAVAAPTLAAAPRNVPLSGGTITVRPDTQIVRILGISGVSTVQLTDANGVGSEVQWGADIPLPVTSGSLNARTGSGTVTSASDVSISGRLATVNFGGFTFNTRKGVVNSGGKKEFTLSGGTVTHDSSGTTISNVELTVTRASAKQLNTIDGDGAITPGMVFGTATIAAIGG